LLRKTNNSPQKSYFIYKNIARPNYNTDKFLSSDKPIAQKQKSKSDIFVTLALKLEFNNNLSKY